MGTQKRTGYVSATKKPEWTKSVFINQDLTAEQQREVKAQNWGFDEVESLLVKLLEQEYKVSVSFDNYNHCFAAWLLPQGTAHVNYGLILTGRGSTPLKAVRQALYKHFVIYEGHTWDMGNNWGAAVFDD